MPCFRGGFSVRGLPSAGGGGSGTVASFTAVNRDTVGTAGGVTLTLTVATITGTPAVAINGVACTSVAVTSSTTITCVTPALSVSGSPYAITCGGQSLSSAITVRQSGSLLASQAFGGALSGLWNTDGGPYSAVTQAGKAAFHQTASALGGNGLLYGNSNATSGISGTAMSTSPGLTLRWYMLLPSATLTSIGGGSQGQIKYHLLRVGNGNNPRPYLMLGSGGDFPPQKTKFSSAVDFGVNIFAQNPVITGDVWHEIALTCWRDIPNSLGHASVWFDGTLQGQTTDANLGDNTTTDFYQPNFGLCYTQNATTYPLDMYIADVRISTTGWLDP